jgi:hypothetical protein
MEAVKTADAETYPDATHKAFLRRNAHLIIHHALEQAKIQGRPPVAALDQNRADEMVRKATRQVRKLQRRK